MSRADGGRAPGRSPARDDRFALAMKSPFLVIAILAMLVLFFFAKLAFSGQILARGDTFLYFYPYWQVAADALGSGRVPLWNPDIFMGAPLLANSQAGFFYPLNWPVWLLFSTPYAVSASILLHVTIAGCGAYLAARRTLDLGRLAALFAGALFALGGYLTAQVEHVNQLQGMAWLPWQFAALAPLVASESRNRSWRGYLPVILATGVLFALQLLAGHTQTTFITGVALAIWLVFHAARKPGRAGKLMRYLFVLVASVMLAAMLAAVQLLPTLELTGQSSRQGGLLLNEVLSFSWHPLLLAQAILPNYSGAFYTEYVFYVPLTAIALAMVGAWSWRKYPAAAPWLWLSIVTIILAFGRFTPAYYLLGRLPGFDLFRAPTRWLAVAALAVALLAGLGWQRLRRYADSDRLPDERRAIVLPLVCAGIGIALLILWRFVAGRLIGLVPLGPEAPYTAPDPRALLLWLSELALAGLLFRAILSAEPARAREAAFELLVLSMAVMWLSSRALPYNQLTTAEAYFDLRPPQARLIATANCVVPDTVCNASPDRFLSLSKIFFDPGDTAEIESNFAGRLDAAALYDYLVAVKHKEVLSPNLSMIHDLPAIDGFDGGLLPLRAYTELMSLILPGEASTTDGRLREYLTAAPEARWISLFNGRYLITDKTGDSWREGVFFDRQHPARPASDGIAVADIPDYEATELWLIAQGSPPPVEVATSQSAVWQLTPALLSGSDLYRVIFPAPVVPEAITLLPCPEGSNACGAEALTLVDGRDKTFQPLTFAPYRLIHSGDVKIYENTAALPRAFMVYDWQWASDPATVIEQMRDPDFDPASSAVIVGDGGHPPPLGGNGTAEIVQYLPEQVSVRVTSDEPGLLVLGDANYPGWTVAIDGLPAEIRQVDGLFRGIFVPAGEHAVEFRFRPITFSRGAVVSLSGLLLLIGLAAWLAIERRGADRP